MPTLLIEPDGNVEFLDVEEGMPLGMIECGFSPGEKKYKPGSIFVLYTDGVTEAMDAKGGDVRPGLSRGDRRYA